MRLDRTYRHLSIYIICKYLEILSERFAAFAFLFYYILNRDETLLGIMGKRFAAFAFFGIFIIIEKGMVSYAKFKASCERRLCCYGCYRW